MADSINSILGSSSLFNSASTTTNNSTSSLFSSLSGSSSSSNILGDFASIKSGSYKKLLKAYYAQEGSESGTSTATGLTKTEQKQVTLISSDMAALKEASDALKTTGRNSLFKEGEKDYDYDKIYDAVKTLVDTYNSSISDTADISITAMDKKVSLTKSMLSKNSALLKDVGITIKDDKLSIDEATFKKADISKIKTLFNGTGSLSDKLATRASSIYSITQSILGKSTSLYTRTGSMKNSSSSGNLVDTKL